MDKAQIYFFLNKILQNPLFKASATLSRMLDYIIHTTLDGNERILKEYTIGVYALGKQTDFNPQKEPLVRIHAYRLRKVMEQYYLTDGQADDVVIEIPKGSYIATFKPRTGIAAAPSAAAMQAVNRLRLSIAVLPFICTGQQAQDDCIFLADGIPDQLSTQLTRYEELSVISYFSCRQLSGGIADIRKAGLLLDAMYVLTGTLQSHGHQIRLQVQLTLSSTNEQIWGATFDCDPATQHLFAMQDDIVWQVAAQIAGHYGAIARHIARLPPQKHPADMGIYNAMFWYYHFVRDLSKENFEKAEEAMQLSVQNDPAYALGWAVLGEILVGGYFMGHTSRLVKDQLAVALDYGKKAIRLDPQCQHGYQTIALAGIFCGLHTESMQVIAAWQKISPAEPGIMGAMGFISICCEAYEPGYEMLMTSIQLNPYYQWWYNAGLAFYFLKKGQYEPMIYWAEKMNRPDVPWEWILKYTGHRALGNREEATDCSRQMLTGYPWLAAVYPVYLRSFLTDAEILDVLKNNLDTVFST